MNYFVSLWSAFSQIINTIIGGNPNESISGRAFREREDSYVWLTLYRVINTAFFFQGDHCKAAYFVDLLQAEGIVNQHYTDVSTIKELLDTMDEEVMKAAKEEEDSYDVPKSIGMVVSKTQDATLAEIAPTYEKDWRLFGEVLADKDRRKEWIEKVKEADWPEIVSTYETQLLNDIRINGTVFAFSSDIASTILDAVRNELTHRSTGRIPKGHGMGDDGRQK